MGLRHARCEDTPTYVGQVTAGWVGSAKSRRIIYLRWVLGRGFVRRNPVH